MWSEKFEDILRPHLRLPASESISPDGSLAGYGLDSMATITLLIDIEEQFAVTFPDELLLPETFATAANLWGVLSTLLEDPAMSAEEGVR